MDGIDAALVELPENRLVYGLTKKYSSAVSDSLNKLMTGTEANLNTLCQLNTLVGREFAAAVSELLSQSGESAKNIKAIGSHGQTVCHDAAALIPYTLQLGCAHTIASRTGIDVVADFRTRDVVEGGQGAPFAPLYHQELFGALNERVAVVNIGGIANVSLIGPSQATVGWDVGPGNCLMDAWIKAHQERDYDEEGHWASQGQVSELLLERLLSDPFFHAAPPKSIGKEYFSSAWLNACLSSTYAPANVQATLLALTARCIADSLHSTQSVDRLYLCGGGAHNKALQRQLAGYLPKVQVANVDEIGVSPDFLEAMMFAWLASQTYSRKPVDLCSITGAHKPSILGALYLS